MKTSEVFELPAYSFGRIVADNISAGGVGSFDSADMAKVAANCINHADALADALESMLEHEKEMAHSVWDYSEEGAATFEESSELARFKNSFADELAALAAYRGVK